MADSNKLKEALMIQSSRMKLLEEVIGGLVHEINNPLSIIMSRAAQLQRKSEKGELDEVLLAQGLKRIEELCDRIAQTVKSNRMLARDASHDEPELVELGTIVDAALPGCEKRLVGHGIELEKKFDPKLLVFARPFQLAQVLLSLLMNSYDELEELSGEKFIRILSEQSGDFVNLKIVDTGPKISPETRGRLMEPFFTTKGEGGSLGIGLSVARELMRANGGDLMFDESALETTFVLKILAKKH